MALDKADRQKRLEFALQMAQKASLLILKYYQHHDLQVDIKHDRSPVTEADRGAELLMREEIEQQFPDDGILGEEFESKPSQNGCQWILDPIDGTKSFIHGVPLFGTLIGLEVDGEMEVGVCRFPALDEVVYAANGSGTWWQIGNNAPFQAKVSTVSNISQALFCTTTLTGWQAIGQRDTLDRLMDATGLSRGWGDCYGHILVATGRADLMVDPELNAWDAAALVPILQEAGGHFIDWNGQPSIRSGNGLSVNDRLKTKALELLQS